MRRGDDLHGRYSMMQQDFICPTGDSGGDDLTRGLNCPLPRAKQRTRTNRGNQLLEPGDGPQVEAYEYDATLDLVAMDHFDDCSGEFSITLLVSERFQFDVHDKICFRLICQEREHIVERGYRLPRVLQAREPAMTIIEPTTDVDLLKLAGGHVCDAAFAQARARQSRVVNHDWHSVARESYVQFNSVGSIAKSPRE